MSDWLSLRVVLTGAGTETLPQPPGRVFLAGPEHTFEDLAEAIDVAFGRWDLTPLHEFVVGGRRLVLGGEEGADDSQSVTISAGTLREGEHFAYVFDLGERWLHDCLVESASVDPLDAYGGLPNGPVPVYGWGMIPDQYGRVSDEEDDQGAVADQGAWDEEEPWEDAAWGQGATGAWEVVAGAVASVVRDRAEVELATAAARLRERRPLDGWPWNVLWAAAGVDGDSLAEDDEELWVMFAAGVVDPEGPLPMEPEAESSWRTLEASDWAGAVIGLAREGPGADADPEHLVELIAACPEIDGDDLTPEDEDILVEGLETVVELWQAIGAVDAQRRLSRLGHWGLVEALRVAWTSPLQ